MHCTITNQLWKRKLINDASLQNQQVQRGMQQYQNIKLHASKQTNTHTTHTHTHTHTHNTQHIHTHTHMHPHYTNEKSGHNSPLLSFSLCSIPNMYKSLYQDHLLATNGPFTGVNICTTFAA